MQRHHRLHTAVEIEWKRTLGVWDRRPFPALTWFHSQLWARLAMKHNIQTRFGF